MLRSRFESLFSINPLPGAEALAMVRHDLEDAVGGVGAGVLQEPVGGGVAGLEPHGPRGEHVRDEAAEDVVHADEPQEVAARGTAGYTTLATSSHHPFVKHS
jgi:hypothetical protein